MLTAARRRTHGGVVAGGGDLAHRADQAGLVSFACRRWVDEEAMDVEALLSIAASTLLFTPAPPR